MIEKEQNEQLCAHYTAVGQNSNLPPPHTLGLDMNWDQKRARLKQRMKSHRKNFNQRVHTLQQFIAFRDDESTHWHGSSFYSVWAVVYICYRKYMRAKREYEEHLAKESGL